MAEKSSNPLIMGSWDFGQVSAPHLLQEGKVQNTWVRTGKMEGDGKIYLSYISALSTTEIIKTAE